MIVDNDMLHDSRVDRHAKTFGMIGHEVTVLCRTFETNKVQLERRQYYSIIRYPSRPILIARELLSKGFEGSFASRVRLGAKVGSLIIPYRLGLYKLALSMRAHVYYCNDLDTLDVGIVLKAAGRKLVYDSHELYVDMIPIGYRSDAYALFETLFISLADVLITVNPFIAQVLRRRYKIKKRIDVVLNCPETLPPLQEAKKRSKFVTVLYHGGLDPNRGLENLIVASRYFHKNIRLVIRGEGRLENELKQLASDRHNVSFEKYIPVNEVVRAASAADIGVIAYVPTNLNQYYSSPNKLFEYIQAGLAVVTSDLPFLRHIVTDNKIGTVFDPRDPVDIAEKINFASRNPNLNTFKRNAIVIRQRYAWEEEKKKLLSACRSLVT
jgi:glycosyltransferase involved in cell wall biosynthesis